MIFKYISPIAFIVSLIIGLFFVYISHPSPEVILVYPTPYNTDQMHCKDKAGTCFKFKEKQVDCPENNTAKIIPVQN